MNLNMTYSNGITHRCKGSYEKAGADSNLTRKALADIAALLDEAKADLTRQCHYISALFRFFTGFKTPASFNQQFNRASAAKVLPFTIHCGPPH